jgi:succinate dehydrogenase/fumarate reductase flavoprotein subunit
VWEAICSMAGRRERFMERAPPIRLERSTCDIVSRSSYLEIMAGRGSSHGGVCIDVSHLGAHFIEQNFRGMVERCRDVGFDLTHEPVEVGGDRADRLSLFRVALCLRLP